MDLYGKHAKALQENECEHLTADKKEHGELDVLEDGRIGKRTLSPIPAVSRRVQRETSGRS